MPDMQEIKIPRSLAEAVKIRPNAALRYVMKEISRRSGIKLAKLMPTSYESDLISETVKYQCVSNPLVQVNGRPFATSTQPHVLQINEKNLDAAIRGYVCRLADPSVFVYVGEPAQPKKVFKIQSELSLRS